MQISRRTFLATASAFAVSPAFAQAYPSRPVKILVGFAAGGGTDLITRFIADAVGQAWGSNFVIENRPGAGTVLASQAALSADPDGYTMLAISGSFIVSPLLIARAPYVYERDFTPVALFASSPHVLVVHPSTGVKNLRDFAEWAKSKQGGGNFASFGRGSSNHLGFEVLKRKLGIEMAHVPYAGSAPAMNDLLSGHVQAMLGDLQNIAEHVRAGKLVAIAVANEKRLGSLPEVPTLTEAGVAGFTSKSWFGMVARAGTSADVVAKWNAAIRTALKSDAVRKKLEPLGVELADTSVEEFGGFLKAEAAQAAYAVEVSGAKAN